MNRSFLLATLAAIPVVTAAGNVSVPRSCSIPNMQIHLNTWMLQPSCTPPSVTGQPQDSTVCPSATATFSVAAAGTDPLSYQWQVNLRMPGDGAPQWCYLTDLQPGGGCLGSGGGGPSHAHFFGVWNATLSISALSPIDSREYRCIVTNACGTAATNAAILTICTPDFTCDGTLNSADFFEFLAAFFTNSPAADFNTDAIVSSQDFFDFLAAFFVGCS